MSRLHFPVFNSIQSLPTLHKYDLIVLFHVLEHIGDPVEFLSRLRALLSPGGKIVVEVPSENDIMLRNVAYRKSYFFQKAHIFYFNAASVFDVALEAGLGCRIKPIQRYNLLNHIRWIVLKRNRGDGYYRDLRKSFIGKIYAKLLTVFGVSDTLWVEMESN
jgi:SAM-dependent methyltransferase